MFRNSINAARRLGLGIKAKTAAAGSALMVGAGSAMAAVPAEVTTALEDTKTDVTTIAGLAFVIFLVIVAFRYFRSGAH